MSIQDEVDERKGTQEVGHRTSTSDPVQYHACIRTGWRDAAVELVMRR